MFVTSEVPSLHTFMLVLAYVFVGSVLNSLVQSTQPGGGNSLNVNGLDLPATGPGLNLPPQGPSMSASGGSANMPPPNWPQTQQLPGEPMGQPRPGMMPTNQPRGQLPNSANIPPGPGPQPQQPMMQGATSQPSAPEMKRAYDALGLTFPGGAQHGAGPVMPQPGMPLFHSIDVFYTLCSTHLNYFCLAIICTTVLFVMVALFLFYTVPGQTSIGPIISSIPSKDQPAKEWHKNVAIDLRNHLVHKLYVF